MAFRRRVLPLNSTIDPFAGGKAGSKDARKFISGNTAGTQDWDIQQQSAGRSSIKNYNIPQYAAAHASRQPAEFVVRTVPTRLNMTPWTRTLQPNETTLLIPKNINRLSLIFTNPFSTYMVISFGPMIYRFNVMNDALGIAIPKGEPLLMDSEGISIDDVYIFNGDTAATQVLAYEGIEAIEANI